METKRRGRGESRLAKRANARTRAVRARCEGFRTGRESGAGGETDSGEVKQLRNVVMPGSRNGRRQQRAAEGRAETGDWRAQETRANRK